MLHAPPSPSPLKHDIVCISVHSSCSEYARQCQWISHLSLYLCVFCTHTNTECALYLLYVLLFFLLEKQKGRWGCSMEKKKRRTSIRKWLSFIVLPPFHFIYFFYSFIHSTKAKKGNEIHQIHINKMYFNTFLCIKYLIIDSLFVAHRRFSIYKKTHTHTHNKWRKKTVMNSQRW